MPQQTQKKTHALRKEGHSLGDRAWQEAGISVAPMASQPYSIIWILRGLSVVPCLPCSASALHPSFLNKPVPLTDCKKNITKHLKPQGRKKEERRTEEEREARREGQTAGKRERQEGKRWEVGAGTWPRSVLPVPGQPVSPLSCPRPGWKFK